MHVMVCVCCFVKWCLIRSPFKSCGRTQRSWEKEKESSCLIFIWLRSPCISAIFPSSFLYSLSLLFPTPSLFLFGLPFYFFAYSLGIVSKAHLLFLISCLCRAHCPDTRTCLTLATCTHTHTHTLVHACHKGNQWLSLLSLPSIRLSETLTSISPTLHQLYAPVCVCGSVRVVRLTTLLWRLKTSTSLMPLDGWERERGWRREREKGRKKARR